MEIASFAILFIGLRVQYHGHKISVSSGQTVYADDWGDEDGGGDDGGGDDGGGGDTGGGGYNGDGSSGGYSDGGYNGKGYYGDDYDGTDLTINQTMKVLFIALFITITTQYVFAQDANHTIEIHLNLMERNNPLGLKELDLGVSIINHSDKDIYIPNFRVFSSYSGIHFYEKEDKVWREINPATHDYYRPVVYNKPIRRGDTVMNVGSNTIFYSDENGFTKQYKMSNYTFSKYQDSLIKSYYDSAPNHNDLMLLTLYQQNPLFIKAHQTLDNYFVRSLDYLLTKKIEYKISFNTEARDTLYYYREPRMYSNQEKQYEELHYPEQIYGYQLFYPKEIISNTIYYTNDKAIIKNK